MKDSKDFKISEKDGAALEKKLLDLRKSIKIPVEHLKAIVEAINRRKSIKGLSSGELFDVNRFLDVFDRVYTLPGYVLDYYHDALKPEKWIDLHDIDRESDVSNAAPEVFTRPKDIAGWDKQVQYLSINAWHLNTRTQSGIFHVEFERSAMGYLQFVVFSRAVHQFYLFWHAGYDDLKFILSKKGLKKIIKNNNGEKGYRYVGNISDKGIEKLTNLDIRPRIRVAGDFGEVKVLTFTKWGGFSFNHIFVRWPNHIERVKEKLVLRYDCGYVY